MQLFSTTLKLLFPVMCLSSMVGPVRCVAVEKRSLFIIVL